MNVILASESPRRKDLLQLIYPEFQIIPAFIDESLPDDIGSEFAPLFLAAAKADMVAESHPDELIIAADTVVVLDGKIYGKPHDTEDAKRILNILSGKTHKVITGCSIVLNERCVTFSEESYVSFYPLSNEDIEAYVDSGEPLGKAGAYAIQGKGALLVKSIDGDYNNIVGLPVSRLNQELKAFLNEK